MHALKDYYGMVKVLEDFPEVQQTFNLVPSMVQQIAEYAAGEARDPFLNAALKPAEDLTEGEQEFILHYFFQATMRMIGRFPRYRDLFDAWHAAGHIASRARRLFATRDLRDLQVLSQLAWFDEEFLAQDREVVDLVHKGRDYTLGDQRLIGEKQLEIMNRVLPVYSEFAGRGQIEISTTPYYHPILPLLCDSNIAGVSHPYVPLPSRFRYPQDASEQIGRALDFSQAHFGQRPAGLWPSEGSVSDQVLAIAAEKGVRWVATDNGVLSRTLQRSATPDVSYRPYLWRQEGIEMRVIFRDHYLSDLIGFVYSKMPPSDAADHFLHHIRMNAGNRGDMVVPIILDGENAWEHYEANGRPFLRELYRRVTDDDQMSAVTVSDAITRLEASNIGHIFPGSWINANFDVWIGADEDNKAWEYLLRARETYDNLSANAPEKNRRLAYEELLIAEGSDWCWWYGPEHSSENRPEFDQLYRDHLANVYRLLGVTPPDELSRPILKIVREEFYQAPVSPIQAKIDGEVTSYYEWMGAGHYRADTRTGSMHGKALLVRDLYYGSDGSKLYVRLDVTPDADFNEINLLMDSKCIPLLHHPEVESAREKIIEAAIPLSLLGVSRGGMVRFQLTLTRDGLPLDMIPQQNLIEFSTADPTE